MGHGILKKQTGNQADNKSEDEKKGLENMIQMVSVLHPFTCIRKIDLDKYP